MLAKLYSGILNYLSVLFKIVTSEGFLPLVKPALLQKNQNIKYSLCRITFSGQAFLP